MIPSLALLNTLFDSLPLGVVVLNAKGEVVIFNREEARLARRSRDRVIGRTFFTEIAPCMNVQELGLSFERNIGREPIDVTIDFSFPFPFLEQPGTSPSACFPSTSTARRTPASSSRTSPPSDRSSG